MGEAGFFRVLYNITNMLLNINFLNRVPQLSKILDFQISKKNY